MEKVLESVWAINCLGGVISTYSDIQVWVEMISAPLSTELTCADPVQFSHVSRRTVGPAVGGDVVSASVAEPPSNSSTQRSALTWSHYFLFLLCLSGWLAYLTNVWRGGYVPDLHKACGADGEHEWRGYSEAFFICKPQCLDKLGYSVYNWMCEQAGAVYN